MLMAVVVMVGESAMGSWMYVPLEEVVDGAPLIVVGKVASVSRDSAFLHVKSILKNSIGQKVEAGGTITLAQPAQHGVSIDLPRHKLGIEGVWMLTEIQQNAFATTRPDAIQPLSSKERIAEIIARLERERSAVLESVLREEEQRDAELTRLPLYDAARFEADFRSGPRPTTDADRWHAMYVSEQRSHIGWVFVDTSGTVALATRYPSVAGNFVGGLVPVGVETRKGYISSYGFMKASGEIAFSGYESAAAFSEGLAAVSKKGRHGYVDSAGKIAIPLEYESAGQFSGGLAEVRKGDQKLLIDTYGKVIFQCRYEDAGVINEGLLPVRRGHRHMYVGRMELELDPEKLGFGVHRAEAFYEGLAAVQIETLTENDRPLWGYVGRDGTMAIEPQFEEADVFSEGRAGVMLARPVADKQGAGSERRRGFIDTTGRLVIPAELIEAQPFSEGLAAVQQLSWMKNPHPGAPIIMVAKWGFIGPDGKMAIKPRYDRVVAFRSGLSEVFEGDHYGLIDRTGRYVWRAKQR